VTPTTTTTTTETTDMKEEKGSHLCFERKGVASPGAKHGHSLTEQMPDMLLFLSNNH